MSKDRSSDRQNVVRVAALGVALAGVLSGPGCDNGPQVDRTVPKAEIKSFTPPDPSKPIPKGMPKQAPELKLDPVTGRPISQ